MPEVPAQSHADLRIGDRHGRQRRVTRVGRLDRVVDDLADRVVARLGGDLGDGQVRGGRRNIRESADDVLAFRKIDRDRPGPDIQRSS